MKIALVGYRGTGKSTVATILGRTLGWQVVSTDAELCARAGMSVPEIVDQRGWSGFRDIEEGVVADLVRREHVVLDCGGGVIEREANIERLRDDGPVVWLTASPPAIAERIAGDTQRPALTHGKSFTEEIEEVLRRRGPLYDRVSDYRVDTENRSPDEIALEVLELVAEDIEHTAVRSFRR